MSADMERGLAGYGLTEARAPVLWRVGEAKGMTQRDLADALKVSARNVTTLIDALVDTGFVKRTPHPTDRRAVLVVLTAKGQKTYARLQSEMTRFATLVFGAVPEKDLRSFRGVLEGIGAVLSGLAAPKRRARRR